MSLIDTDPPEEAKLPGTQSDDDILSEARDRYKICDDLAGDNNLLALEDLRFLKGGHEQWDDRAVAARERDGRPIITVNTLPTYLHQVTNDQRQNTPAIKVHPVGDGADIETAKIRQGLIRHIEYASNADVCYDTAVNSAAAVGFGYFRIMPEYCKEDSFDQDLRFKRIRNALSVKMGPHVEPDGSDVQYVFIESPMPRDEFKRDYPDATASSDSVFSDGQSAYTGWLSDSIVLICEYYRIEKTPAEIVLLSDGSSGFRDEIADLNGATVIKARSGFRHKVMWYKITAVDILERAEIKCKWIPVYPVYGDEIDIEGKVTRSGIIRHAKGPCQSYNVMMSGATEEVALRTKAPYIGAEGQFEGHEDEWQQANSRAFPYLEYKPTTVDGKLAPAPQRQPMADVPTGMLALALHAKDNIKATTGLFDASLGAKGTATSGVQEKAQQQEGDMANFHFYDGLLRTMKHVGRCLNCMIPHYYDSERIITIMRDDGTQEYAPINKPQPAEVDPKTGAIRSILNDLTCGEYDTTVSSGPPYTTLRQEAAEGMAENMAKNPQLWGVIGDLYVKNQDWPGADEMAERIKKTIPPELRGPEEGEEEPPPMVPTPQGPVPLPQAAQMIGDLMMQLEQAGEAVKQADGAKQQAEAMKQQHAMREQELEPSRNAVEEKKLEATIAQADASRAAAQAALVQAQADLVRAQTEAQLLPERTRIEAAQAEDKALQAQIKLNTPEQPQAPQEQVDPAQKETAQMTAQAARIKAEADLLRAKAEARQIPEMTITHPNGNEYLVSMNGQKPDVKKAEKSSMPKAMTIRNPKTGINYEVSLH